MVSTRQRKCKSQKTEIRRLPAANLRQKLRRIFDVFMGGRVNMII